MKVTPARIPEVLMMEPAVFGDDRGWFMESFSADRYARAGITGPFVQDSVSYSRRGVLRGLHVQHPWSQGKLVSVLHGEAFDVAVDVRGGSPTRGQWTGEMLSGENHRQLWIPPGFAHGFVVISEHALFSYKCTEVYHPEAELSIAWNDPDIGIDWPAAEVQLSPKDRAAPRLRDVDPAMLPTIG